MPTAASALIVLLLSSNYLVEDARRACDEYNAAQTAAARGAPLMGDVVKQRKARCEAMLGKAKVSIQAETARKAAAALQQQQKKADNVMLSWAQSNQKDLLKHAQTVGTTLNAHSTELNNQLKKLNTDSKHLRDQLRAARNANDDEAYRKVVDKLKPYELERMSIEKERANVSRVKQSLDNAASKLGTLQTATDKVGEALDVHSNLKAGEYTKATKTVLSNLDEINDLRIDKVQTAIKNNPWNTWDDLHRQLADEGVLKKATGVKSGIGVLKKVAAVKELYNEAVELKNKLNAIDQDDYSPESTKNAAKAFRTVGTLLDKASEFLPDSVQNAVKGTAAALNTVDNVRSAVSKAEAKRVQGAIDTTKVSGQERTAHLGELKAPDSDGVLLADNKFEGETGVRVWKDHANNRVYIKDKDGKLVRLTAEEWAKRQRAIANYGELTDGKAKPGDYEKILQGRKVKGGQIAGIFPKQLDADSLTDGETAEWIRHEAAERAAAETAYTGAYSQAEWDALSEGEKLKIRNKWREFEEMSRAAGRGDPTPNQFNTFLEGEEANRKRLEELAAKRKAEEEALAQAAAELDADGGTASDTDATFDTDSGDSDDASNNLDADMELMADLMANGDDAGAAEIYERLTGASPDEARDYINSVREEVAFSDAADAAKGTTGGADDVPDMPDLPDDDTLLDDEGRNVRLDPDSRDPDDLVDIDRAVTNRGRSGRDGVPTSRGGDASQEINRVLDGERRNRARAATQHNRTVQNIEQQTARNKANHKNVVRQSFGTAPKTCPAGLISCGCPETHSFVWCHPPIPGGCGQKMGAHDFPF